MFWVPGRSFRGPLPQLSDDGRKLAKRLSEHFWMLAGDIGARSLTSAPEILPKTAANIEHVFRGSGYDPSRQEFSVETLSHHQHEVTGEGIRFRYETLVRVCGAPGVINSRW